MAGTQVYDYYGVKVDPSAPRGYLPNRSDDGHSTGTSGVQREYTGKSRTNMATMTGDQVAHANTGWKARATTEMPSSNPRASSGSDAPTTGTHSGAGILENWFNRRASGTDPGYEYAMKRGMDAVDTRMAAGGSFNSGARGMQLSDMAANMGTQRQGQLDALAAGASGEHRGRLNDMFNVMLGLAGGQTGVNTAYDMAAGDAQTRALMAALGLEGNKAGVDQEAAQGAVSNLINMYTAYNSGGKS